MIICLDTETTGSEAEDRILQLALLVSGEELFPTMYNECCDPKVAIKFDAMAVHHITPEMVAKKPLITDTVPYKKLLSYNTPENYLVIQNAAFDLDMLAKEGFSSNMKLIDTIKIARHRLPDSPKHGLQYLRYSLGIYKQEAQYLEMIKAHDALGDVIVLYNLLQYFLDTGLSLDEMVELTVKPVLFKNFNFGKYRGQSIEQCRDRGYLEWCLKNMAELTDDWRYTLEYYYDKLR